MTETINPETGEKLMPEELFEALRNLMKLSRLAKQIEQQLIGIDAVERKEVLEVIRNHNKEKIDNLKDPSGALEIVDDNAALTAKIKDLPSLVRKPLDAEKGEKL